MRSLLIMLCLMADVHPFHARPKQVGAAPVRLKRVLFFTAPWCGYCQTAKGEIDQAMVKASNWSMDETANAHIQLVDADKNPQLVAYYKVPSLPYFVAIDGDRIVEVGGYKSAANIARMHNQMYGK